MSFLRKSTDQFLNLGPFVDATNAVTPETGEGGTGMDVFISKDGGAYAARNSTAVISHDRAGHYRVQLSSTDTNTVGILRINVSDPTVHLDVTSEYFVADEDYYDTVTGSIKAPVNVVEVGGTGVSDVSDFKADLTGISTFDPDSDQVFLKGTTHDGAVIDTVLHASSATVADIDTSALAKFATVDTGESVASEGSVAQLSKGGSGGNTTVGAFTLSALQELVQTDTGLNSANTGSVVKISQGASGLDAATVEQACEEALEDVGWTSALATQLGGLSAVAGSGAVEETVTVTDNLSNPIDGAEVWITTDAAGTNTIAGTLATNADGQATFMLDEGNYFVWIQKSGYNFGNPNALTVTA